MLITEQPHCRGLSSLFSNNAYSEILEQIFGYVGLSDTANLLRVNKHKDLGYLLMVESTHKIPLGPNDDGELSNPIGYKFDPYSIWNLSTLEENTQEMIKNRGATKNQSYYKWKFDQFEKNYFQKITMCPEDNVIAVARQSQDVRCREVTPGSQAMTNIKVYLYQLIPSRGTNPPLKGIFKESVRHPESALEFIEIRVPAKYHAHHITIKLSPNVRLGILLKSPTKFSFLGFWNWKKGLCLGSITPPPGSTSLKDVLVDDFQFFDGKLNFKGSIITSQKLKRGYKVRGRTSLAGPRNTFTISHKDDFEDDERDLYGDEDDTYDAVEPGKVREDFYACINTYELLNISNGKKSSAFVHKAYTETGYDPNEPCTWEYRDLPICSGITSFLTPPLSNYTTTPLDSLLSPGTGNVVSTRPTGCVLGEIMIDDGLLKGERDGIMNFTILTTLEDDVDGEMPSKCQGTINLKTIINAMTIILTNRIKNKHLDPRGHSIQTNLSTMWSDDPSVQQTLNSQLGLDIRDEDIKLVSDDGDQDGKDWSNDPKQDRLMVRLLNESIKNDERSLPGSSRWSKTTKLKKRPSHTYTSNNETPYLAHYIPYEEWKESCSFRFSFAGSGPSTYGSNYIMTEPNYSKLGQSAIQNTFAQDIKKKTSMFLILRDFNTNLRSNIITVRDEEDRRRLQRISIGGKSIYKDTSLFLPDPSTLLKDTVVYQCKLPKPIDLPNFINKNNKQRVESSISTKTDKDMITDCVFTKQTISSEYKFIETRIEFQWDMKRQLENVFFDGNTIVMHMQNGAHIMTFD
ncbi:uncharacterized protein L201_004020 [Kwoniella dendrophila CBS 6074]|uniref:F-box domain-containing protein n=1 Tax=Kwoniella dendrophila CBS 6074 TaxID=1295534 RepID=A0AAX4JUN2_9TREE